MLEKVGIAYVSIAEADWEDAPELPIEFRKDVLQVVSGRILYAGKYNIDKAVEIVNSGLTDLMGFGRPFIANPDLPDRILHGWPWNPLNPATLYGGAKEGYTDYPVYSEA